MWEISWTHEQLLSFRTLLCGFSRQITQLHKSFKNPGYDIVYCGRSFLNLRNVKECGFSSFLPPIPVAARSKAWVFVRLLPGIVGSNPAWGMDVCLLCLLCLSVGKITRLEDCYQIWCVCDREVSMQGRPWPDYGPKRRRRKKYPMKCLCSPSSLHGFKTLIAPKMNLHRCGTSRNGKEVEERWCSICVFIWPDV